MLAPFRKLHPLAKQVIGALAVKFVVAALVLYVQWDAKRPRVRVKQVVKVRSVVKFQAVPFGAQVVPPPPAKC